MNLTQHDEVVRNKIDIIASIAAALAVLVIFAVPMIDLLPAPQTKQFSPSVLLMALLVLMSTVFVATDWSNFFRHAVADPVLAPSERLEVICTHRC